MAELWTLTKERRVTFLAVFDTLQGDYDASVDVVNRLQEDGFFDEESERRPTPASSGRSGTSNGRGSSSRPSNTSRGRDQGQRPAFSGQYRDPDAPPTEKQVNAVLKMTDDYSSDELWDMTISEVGSIISDLKG